MKRHFTLLPRSTRWAVFCSVLMFSSIMAESVDVPKSNPMKVYMHMMPWFDTPEVLGGNNWGLHWTMANRNPNNVAADGRREIASHYYPKTGPYQSSNPDIIEYQMLLMKYSGVDGVLLDWYGIEGANGDVGRLLSNSNAIVDRVGSYGLEFAAMLEDRFSTVSIGGAPDIQKARNNVAYLRDNYFNRPEYIRLGAAQEPLLPVFGPITFEQPADWTDILSQAGEDVEFLPLWYQSNDAGSNADGEFSWVYEDEARDDHLIRAENFLQSRAPTLDVAAGSAYPGFDDFYAEGGWGSGFFEIPHADGQTLNDTLALVGQYDSNLDFLQLVTWNDYGEGTMLEPTVENGFGHLVQLQQFTGVPFSESELELIYRLYTSRSKYADDSTIQLLLSEVSRLLNELNVSQATTLLDIVAPRGDYDADGDVDLDDYNFWVGDYGNLYVVHGSSADGNYDGVVDAADFTVWRDSYTSSQTVPEPSSGWLLMLAFCLVRGFHASCRSETYRRLLSH